MDAELPRGWRQVKLGDIANVISGQSPPGSTVIEWDGTPQRAGLPFVQGNAEFGAHHPTPTKWCLLPIKKAEQGDSLLSVRAPVGETNRAHVPLAIGRGLAAIRFRGVDPAFGWHALNLAKSAFERVAQGSTFDAIGAEIIRDLVLAVPPDDEQRAIAATLDAIDETTERAEHALFAYRAAKRAVANALLHGLVRVPSIAHRQRPRR